MASEDEKGEKGLPGWVMTFADLMTLLMCFFVLMLSFSEMDVAKFKQLAGSMQNAFGVQAEIEARTMPRGTSIIAQEFSPGTPRRTVLNEVRQATVNSNFNNLDVTEIQRALQLEKERRRAEQEAQRLRVELAEEIAEGRLLVRNEGVNVIVQILERDSFPSGSSSLETDMMTTLARVGSLLGDTPGAIAVSGHTDNVPIATSQFRSNWDLSAARAATVAHELLEAGIDPARVMISGHADTQPRADNDTPENRALNRRIDISVFTNRERHDGWNAIADPEPDDEPVGDAASEETEAE